MFLIKWGWVEPPGIHVFDKSCSDAGDLIELYKEYKRAEQDRAYTWWYKVLLNEGRWRKERNADN